MRIKVFDVFAGQPFEGNPTAVVYWEGTVDRDRMQDIAAELAVPDTIFLTRSDRSDLLFSSHTFSPYEELSVCGQGILAGVFAVMEDQPITPGIHAVGTRQGVMKVFLETGKGPCVFTSLGRPDVALMDHDGMSRMGEALGFRFSADWHVCFVDLGRRRVIADVPLNVLSALPFDKDRVMAACRTLEITGLVFCSRGSDGTVRSRHFARSLNGAEDAVTGGAAGAILASMVFQGVHCPTSPLVVHQGGFETRGGLIHARVDSQSGEILVGGSGVKVLDGHLLV